MKFSRGAQNSKLARCVVYYEQLVCSRLSTIRIKIFLRDDMLEQAVSVPEGFTALTHLTARQADTLRWSEENILTMLVKRLFANEALRKYPRCRR